VSTVQDVEERNWTPGQPREERFFFLFKVMERFVAERPHESCLLTLAACPTVS
jgi:hypothetical protein